MKPGNAKKQASRILACIGKPKGRIPPAPRTHGTSRPPCAGAAAGVVV